MKKSQIPNPKSQKTAKSQIPTAGLSSLHSRGRLWDLEFGILLGFGSWDLGFPRRRLRRRAGFTLIEVMAAVMILAIVALVVLDQRNGAIQKAQGISEHRQATLALKAKLGEIELEKNRTTGQTGGDFQEPEFQGLTWRADITEEEWDFSDPALGQLPPVKVHKIALTVAPVEADAGTGWSVVTYLPLPGKDAGQNPSNQ